MREQGNYFQVPVAMKVGGLDALFDLDGDCDAILYDSDGTTVLGTASFDKDNRSTAGADVVRATFAADVTLSAGVWYRMVWKPTSATSITGREYAVNALASFDALPGGQFCYWTQKSDAGVWSETDSKRARIALVVTEIHDGSGGGGGQRVIGG